MRKSAETGAPIRANIETRFKVRDIEWVQPVQGGRWARLTPDGATFFVPGWEGELAAEVVRLRERVKLLTALEWSYPPVDAIKSGWDKTAWRGPARCPMCFGDYPNHHTDRCLLAHAVHP